MFCVKIIILIPTRDSVDHKIVEPASTVGLNRAREKTFKMEI